MSNYLIVSARLIYRLNCGGNLAFSRQSIKFGASGPKICSAHSLSSLKNLDSDFVPGLKLSICHFCFFCGL